MKKRILPNSLNRLPVGVAPRRST